MRIGSNPIAATVLMIVMVWFVNADAAVRYVALDGSGADGQTWATAYRTIQVAVDDPAIGAGDEIRVKQGTYVIAQPVEVNKAVKIYGGYSGSDTTRDWSAYPTTIDCADDAKRGFSIYANARIDGFTITQGHSWGMPPNEGGAVWINSCGPVVANCMFYRNYSEENGGAISTYRASGATIADCAFIENTAEYYGGAIYNDDSRVTIAGCTFTDNEAKATDGDVDPNDPIPGGGAIFNEDSVPTISDCVFAGNSAYYGAGLSNYFTDAYVEGCVFADCGSTAVAGGGIYNYGYSSTIKGCLFRGNSVTYAGGAVLDVSTSTFVNCIMSGNSAYLHGGAVYVHRGTLDTDSEPVFTNCTLYGNDAVKGGGLYSDNARPTVTNSIFWGNTALSDEDGPGIWDSRTVWSGAGVTVTYCDVQGDSTYPGLGNRRVDPGFVDPAGGDFDLPFGSPCIDVGNNDATGLPTDDYEGKPRITDGNEDGVAVVDMGAFEFRGRYVSDYLWQARAFQTQIYDDPSDTVATHVFLLEFETSSSVDYIEFQAPSGRTYTIPNAPYTSTYVKTYHRVVGGAHVWGYWVEFNPMNPPADYGDGTYHVSLHYLDGVTQGADLWYGVPNTGSYLTAPTQVPDVSSPTYGGTAGSPVTFSWAACTDTNANHVSVTIIHSGTDEEVLTDVLDAGQTESNAYALDEGQYDAEIAFENSYDVTNPDTIPFEYGKAVLIGHQFEVVFSTVYRFWSPTTSRHFYTMNVAERDYIIDTYSSDVWTYEGPVFSAYATHYVSGLAPVYRFWSPSLSSHFYTISQEEKEHVINTYSSSVWTYEGIAFYAYPPEGGPVAGTSPVYRFWNDRDGAHFYTMSEEERAHILNTYAFFIDEGIAFYAYE